MLPACSELAPPAPTPDLLVASEPHPAAPPRSRHGAVFRSHEAAPVVAAFPILPAPSIGTHFLTETTAAPWAAATATTSSTVAIVDACMAGGNNKRSFATVQVLKNHLAAALPPPEMGETVFVRRNGWQRPSEAQIASWFLVVFFGGA